MNIVRSNNNKWLWISFIFVAVLFLLTSNIYNVEAIIINGFDYILDRNYYPVPNMAKPNKGASFQDPNFHTTITRVTDRVADGISGTRTVLIPEYARTIAENADGSKLLISEQEYDIYLYDANNFRLLKSLSEGQGGIIPHQSEGSNEPRWDGGNPNVFYFVSRMKFYRYDISTDTMTLIRDFSTDFPGAWKIGTDGEGAPSMDARYWVFMVRNGSPNYEYPAIFTYDLVENRIISILRESNFPGCAPYETYCSMNTATISPYGDRVIVEWTYPSPTISYALDFTDPVRLGNDGHSDIAIDANGNQVHVIKDDSNDVIAILDIKTGRRTNLVTLPLAGSGLWDIESTYHISGNNYRKPGWAVISTYDGSPTDQRNWHYYQVFMLELKENPRIWRIAHTHGVYGDDGTAAGSYWAETKATINVDGTKIWWGSNWGTPSGDIDTYQATLPETWLQDITDAPSVQIQQPTAGNTYSFSGGTLTLSGTATPATNRTITAVNCTNGSGGSCSCSGTTSWSCNTNIASGQNNVTITVTAVDSNNSSGADVLIVNPTSGGGGGGSGGGGSSGGSSGSGGSGDTEISGGGCGYIKGSSGSNSGGNASQVSSFILMLMIILTGITLAKKTSKKILN